MAVPLWQMETIYGYDYDPAVLRRSCQFVTFGYLYRGSMCSDFWGNLLSEMLLYGRDEARLSERGVDARSS